MKNLELYKRIYEVFKPFQGKFAVHASLITLAQWAGICVPLIFGLLIDALSKQKSWTTIVGMIMLMAGSRTLMSLLFYWSNKYEIRNLDFDFPQHITMNGIDKIMAFSIGQHHNQNSGIKIAQIGKGENAINNLLGDVLYNLVPGVSQLLITMVFLAAMNFYLSLVFILGIALYAFISYKMNIELSPSLAQVEKLRNENSRLGGEAVKNVVLVKVNCQTGSIRSEFVSKFSEIAEFGKSAWVNFSRLGVYRNLSFVATYCGVIILGVYYMYQGKITTGLLITFVIWVQNVSGTINNLGQVHRRINKSLASIKDYFENILVKPDILDKENAVSVKDLQGGIEFKNVTFAYPSRANPEQEAKPVLKNLNFKILPNEKVAFVGHSGAGKSTVIQLLIRAYDPSSGQVLVDGHDLRDLRLSSYLGQLGLVEQEVCLFDNTLAYNLQFGLKDTVGITEKGMDEITEACRINEFFHLLENGYDTMIGEKGVKLSGGQKQRVGIARALIKDPRILILDEATSSLDSENEAMIRESIEKASAGRTTIIVAHRLSTIKWVDRIFVMEAGEIVDIGSHDELLEKSSAYQNLMKNQISFV